MGVTNLTIFKGQTKKVRVQAAAPTSPTPVTGEVYVDNSAGYYAMGVYNGTSWLYVSLAV